MTSLIIGDVHNLIHLVDEIVKKYGSRYEEIVIAGDYFDSLDMQKENRDIKIVAANKKEFEKDKPYTIIVKEGHLV